MPILLILKYLLILIICYFSFIVLKKHFTDKMSWGTSIKESSRHIGYGLVIVLANPLGLIVLAILAGFIILTLFELI